MRKIIYTFLVASLALGCSSSPTSEPGSATGSWNLSGVTAEKSLAGGSVLATDAHGAVLRADIGSQGDFNLPLESGQVYVVSFTQGDNIAATLYFAKSATNGALTNRLPVPAAQAPKAGIRLGGVKIQDTKALCEHNPLTDVDDDGDKLSDFDDGDDDNDGVNDDKDHDDDGDGADDDDHGDDGEHCRDHGAGGSAGVGGDGEHCDDDGVGGSAGDDDGADDGGRGGSDDGADDDDGGRGGSDGEDDDDGADDGGRGGSDDGADDGGSGGCDHGDDDNGGRGGDGEDDDDGGRGGSDDGGRGGSDDGGSGG